MRFKTPITKARFETSTRRFPRATANGPAGRKTGTSRGDSRDDDDLVVAIAETLIHEVGHYFGMSEEEIEEIEEQYWRAEAEE